jgi:uncharacterized protein (DUF1501 family)
MNRRLFIKHAAAIAPLIVAFNPYAMAQRGFLQNLIPSDGNNKRKLVLIELTGGNDGLNTVIPIDKYEILSEARRNILIPENKILKLNDTNIFGFHPSMTGLRELYNNRLVSIIQGVGYPDPDLSHFRGIAIKYTANTGKEEIRSGWMGRYLEQEYPQYPKGHSSQMTDGPPAMRFGLVSPKITQGADEDFSIGITNLEDISDLSTLSVEDPVSNNMGGTNINTIRAVSDKIKLYIPAINMFSKKQENLSKLYPEQGKNPLADQLKIIAKLIGSGLSTTIYVAGQSNYDTHGNQVEKSDTTQGVHSNLLKDLSEAITAFEDDLYLMGKQDDVLGMTYSEFGRRIASSDSYGTDHGTSESVILFGTKLKKGIIGSSPDLSSKVNQGDNLPVQFDFRSVYKSVLSDWLGTSEDRIKTIITQGPDEKLDLFTS